MGYQRRYISIVLMMFIIIVFITDDHPYVIYQALSASSAPQIIAVSRKGNRMTFFPNNISEDITVMTFNIHHGRDMKNRDNLDRVVAEIQASGAQIVALQEVDRYMPRSGFKDQVGYIAKKLSMYYVYGETINVLGVRYGNAILSAFPIVEHENISLPSNMEPRGLLKVKIQNGNTAFNILITHLGLSQEERVKQIIQINREVEKTGERTILMGDFNAAPASNEIALLSSKMMDVAASLDKGEIGTYAYGAAFANKRIDYIFVSEDLKPMDYLVNPLGPSDHASVVARLSISQKEKL